MVRLGIVDGVESQLQAAHMKVGIWRNRGAGRRMAQEGVAVVDVRVYGQWQSCAMRAAKQSEGRKAWAAIESRQAPIKMSVRVRMRTNLSLLTQILKAPRRARKVWIVARRWVWDSTMRSQSSRKGSMKRPR